MLMLVHRSLKVVMISISMFICHIQSLRAYAAEIVIVETDFKLLMSARARTMLLSWKYLVPFQALDGLFSPDNVVRFVINLSWAQQPCA